MSSSKLTLVLIIFAIICLVTEAAHEVLESGGGPGGYWVTKLGSTPIPTALKYIFPRGPNDVMKSYDLAVYCRADYHDLTKYNPDAILPEDDRAIFFTDDVFTKPGTKLKLKFTKVNTKTKFLPSNLANSLPNSSKKLSVILSMLSVNPTSSLAKYISKTVNKCEEKGVKGEVRFCANSLEAMIDNVITLNSAKNNVKVFSADVQKDTQLQEFSIKQATKFGNDKEKVVCHKLQNPYAVFLCHSIESTDAYVVSLVGANGQQITAMAQCHMDTSSWNPKSIALQFLKTKPGTYPVCHFLDSEAILWVLN